MNIELEDIKQLLRAELSASESRTAELIVSLATKEDIKRVRNEMATKADLQEAQGAIAETLTMGMESVASKPQVDDHERRITRLEHHAA